MYKKLFIYCKLLLNCFSDSLDCPLKELLFYCNYCRYMAIVVIVEILKLLLAKDFSKQNPHGIQND